MNIRKLRGAMTILLVGVLAGVVWAQLSDDGLLSVLINERDGDGAVGNEMGPLVVPVPGPDDPPLRPVQRVPRAQYGIVGPAPLALSDLAALVYPDANDQERQAVLTGLSFFTTEQGVEVGSGVFRNQPRCLGCHMSSVEAVPGLVATVSQVSRGSRSSPTNFAVTGLGMAADEEDAINDTGKTGAFTIFGDFCAGAEPCARPVEQLPAIPSVGFNGATPTQAFDTLARAPFFGFVQHTRPFPESASCPPKRLPPLVEDPNLGGLDPFNGWMSNWVSPFGFRRQVAERAAPPYIGRGLMEAIPNADILALEDPDDKQGAPVLGCQGDCISGRANMATTTQTIFSAPPGRDVGAFSMQHLGRFGLRAAGPQLIVFDAVGAQEEVGTTSVLRPAENTGPNATPNATNMVGPGQQCDDKRTDPDILLSTLFSLRSLIRMTAPPEFGDTLLELLQSSDPTAQRPAGSLADRVQRGARLFGVDLTAFANRMIPDRMPVDGDDRDMHARIVRNDGGDKKIQTLNCAACHTPVQRTGKSPASVESPANVGARHLSFKWAPIFSDMLLHNMPVIEAERFAPTPRLPLLIRRGGVNTFDLPRNFGEDAIPNQGRAAGDEFRTAPLMGLGRMGPPFLHDARVYLSQDTVGSSPASTVMTNRQVTNAPLVVRTLDDAIRAAIELHDLPARGAGCPVPPVEGSVVRVGDVVYGSREKARQAICPPLDSENRSEAREVMRRFRALSPADQQALIDFLKQL